MVVVYLIVGVAAFLFGTLAGAKGWIWFLDPKHYQSHRTVEIESFREPKFLFNNPEPTREEWAEEQLRAFMSSHGIRDRDTAIEFFIQYGDGSFVSLLRSNPKPVSIAGNHRRAEPSP